MKLKFFSIGLLLTCGVLPSSAQYIINGTGAQANADFNIQGDGTAYRFITGTPYSAVAVDLVQWTLNRTLSGGAMSRRWNVGMTGLEAGSNIGSDYAIWSYDDAGTILRRDFTIRRSNGFVGIGTSTPGTNLHVHGYAQIFNDANSQTGLSIGVTGTNRWAILRRATNDASTPHAFMIYEDNSSVITGSVGPRLTILPGGKTGIGTAVPDAMLHVKTGTQSMKFGLGTNTSGYSFGMGVNDDGVNLDNDSPVRGFNFNNFNGRLLTIASNGNVGIGTSTPNGHKLCVNGSAIFTKAVVKAFANWPDFVFEDDYRLQPIEEVMAYVKEHKHLPGIPSAKEVAEKGQDLGEMNAKLLQKVEELTLYIAEMKKEIDALKADRK